MPGLSRVKMLSIIARSRSRRVVRAVILDLLGALRQGRRAFAGIGVRGQHERPRGSGAAMANAAARNAPDDSPRKWHRVWPVSCVTTPSPPSSPRHRWRCRNCRRCERTCHSLRGPSSRRRSRSGRTRSSIEYSPRPGTVRSKLDSAEIDDPCTRNSTGRAASPGLRCAEPLAIHHQFDRLAIARLGRLVFVRPKFRRSLGWMRQRGGGGHRVPQARHDVAAKSVLAMMS